MRRRLLQALWLVLGIGLLAGVVWYYDPGRTWKALLGALDHPWLLLGALGLFALSQVGFYVKWHLMSRLAGAAPDARQSLRLFATLYLVGTFTPGRAGELAVPLMMRGGARLLGVALVNRILESSITALMGLLALVLAFSGDNPLRNIIMLSGVLLTFGVMMIVLSRRRLTEKLIALIVACLQPFRRLPLVPWLLAKERQVRSQLGPFYEANERILRWPVVLLLSGLMLLIWLVMVAANYLLMLATVGDVVAIAHVLAVIAVVAVAIFLSPIPGGVGVSEGAAVIYLRQLGYTKSNFVPFLLLSRIGFYMVVILFYLAGRVFGRELPEPAPGPDPQSGVPH